MYKSYSNLTLKDLAKKYVEIKEKLNDAKNKKTVLQKEFDHIRLNLIPDIMDEEDIKNVTYDEIGTLILTSDIYASIPADQRDNAYTWLKENKHGGLIKDAINAQTLKAFLKGQIKKGIELPVKFFKITPFTRASIKKK